MKIKVIDKIQGESNYKKNKIIWSLTLFFTFIFFMLWIQGLKNDFYNLKNRESDFSDMEAIKAFGDVKEEWNEVLSNGKETLEFVESELTQDSWGFVANNYIDNKDSLFKDEFSELKVREIEFGEDSTVITFDHYYKGISVANSYILAYFSSDSGDLISEDSFLKQGVDIDVNPEIGVQKAVAIAEDYMQGNKATVFKESNLVVVCLDDNFYLAWSLLFEDEYGAENNRVFVGAKGGNIILPEELDK